MSDQNQQPYIKSEPGDLLTAELWNQLQLDIQDDIANKIKDAVSGIKDVDHAKDADKLGNMNVEQLTDEVVKKVLPKIVQQKNYRMLFKRLLQSTITPDANKIPVLDKITVIEHNLKACPLVDVYQLDYFKVLCATGDDPDDLQPTWVNFYLYHSTEKRIRSKTKGTFDIEPVGHQPYRIPFKDMLEQFKGVNGFSWNDNTTLGDLETDFWKAFFYAPNDEFEEDQFCHSPWFEKASGESRTIADLQKRGDWDDLWFQMRPRRTINFPAVSPSTLPLTAAPTQFQVVHFDFDRLGIALLTKPVYPAGEEPFNDGTGAAGDVIATEKANWLNVIVLLKV